MGKTAAAQTAIWHGNRFPFDAPDDWWNGGGANPPTPVDWAHSAARGVLADLQDRRTIKRGFEGIDEDTRAEIIGSLSDIIRSALEEHNGKPGDTP